MSLEDYQRNGWIQKFEMSSEEVGHLLEVADRDISQSQVPGLGAEWRFDIAYNAALQLAVAVLGHAGFRAERVNKHQRSIECLAFTLRLPRKDLDFLDRCRRKRYIAVYERVGAVSDGEAAELVAFAMELRKKTHEFLKRIREP